VFAVCEVMPTHSEYAFFTRLCSQLTVELYEMLEAINRKVEHLHFMDPISDFLYPFC